MPPDVYRFRRSCVGETCTATVVSGPAPVNTTLPQPARYTFEPVRELIRQPVRSAPTGLLWIG